MPKKPKTTDDRLDITAYLLAGLLLKRKPNVNEVAKILGVAPSKLVEMFPEKEKKGRQEESE